MDSPGTQAVVLFFRASRVSRVIAVSLNNLAGVRNGNRVIELDGAHLFTAEIKNIQIDKQYESMDMKKIDLTVLKPAIYAPYNYFSVGEKLGEMGEWQKHI